MVIYGVYSFYLPINLSYLCLLTWFPDPDVPKSEQKHSYILIYMTILSGYDCKFILQMQMLTLPSKHNRIYPTGWRYLVWIVYLISCPSDGKNGEKLILFPLDSFLSFFPFRNPKETKLTFRTNQKWPKVGFISAFFSIKIRGMKW